VLLLALLFVPVEVDGGLTSDLQAADYDTDLAGEAHWWLRLRWGWGLFRLRLAGLNLTTPTFEMRVAGLRLSTRRQPRTRARVRRERKERAKPRRRPRPSPAVIRSFAEEGLRSLRRLWRSFGLGLSGDLTYGFSDPSLTGFCEATLWTLGRPAHLRLTPDWTQARLEGQAQLHGRLYGFEVAVAFLAMLKNPRLRHYLWMSLKPKWGRRVPAGGRI